MDPKSNQIVTMSLPRRCRKLQLQQLPLLLLCLFFQCLRIAYFFFLCCFALPCLHTESKLPKMICFVWPQTWPHCRCAVAAQWAALSLPWTCSSYCGEYRIKLQFAIICRVDSEVKQMKRKDNAKSKKENIWN